MSSQQCKATNRTGKRCGSPAIQGGTVCRLHGGSAPQVRAAANARLQALVLPSIARIEKIIKDGEDIVAERAARGILDRTGYKEPDKIQVSGHDGGPLVDMTKVKGMDADALDKLGAIFAAALAKHPVEDGEDLA